MNIRPQGKAVGTGSDHISAISEDVPVPRFTPDGDSHPQKSASLPDKSLKGAEFNLYHKVEERFSDFIVCFHQQNLSGISSQTLIILKTQVVLWKI